MPTANDRLTMPCPVASCRAVVPVTFDGHTLTLDPHASGSGGPCPLTVVAPRWWPAGLTPAPVLMGDALILAALRALQDAGLRITIC